MSTAECIPTVHTDMEPPLLPRNGNGQSSPRALHRLREVRRRQGVSLRRVARHMRRDIREVRAQEEEHADLSLSDLYLWQQALDVPVAELLVDLDSPLSPPVMERARMVKLMKTAAAIREKAEHGPLRRMTDTLIEQLVEIMPELKGVSPWHAVGQRRTLDELGRAVERGMSIEFPGER